MLQISKFTKLKVVELSKKPETLLESLLGSRSRSVLFAHISLYVIPWRSGQHILMPCPCLDHHRILDLISGNEVGLRGRHHEIMNLTGSTYITAVELKAEFYLF